MKTVIYPGPKVDAATADPLFYSARLGVSLVAGVPKELHDFQADKLLACGTVRLVEAPAAAPAPPNEDAHEDQPTTIVHAAAPDLDRPTEDRPKGPRSSRH